MAKKIKKQSSGASTNAAAHNPLIEIDQRGDVSWVNIQDQTATETYKVLEQYGVHPSHVHSLTSGINQIPQISIEKEYIFIVLAQPYKVKGKDKIASKSIAIYLGKKFLITVHHSQTPTPKLLFDEVKATANAKLSSPAIINYHLVNRLLEDIQEQTEAVSVQLDKIETKVFDDTVSDSLAIARLRQKIIRLRRALAPAKSVLEELQESINKFTSEELRHYYVTNTNMSHRLWETIEEAKETIEVYKDADFTSSTERTNQILAILTIIFTLAIPGTLFGTYYGMNIILPGGTNGEHHQWTFLGPFTTLILIIGASVLAGFLMYVWFKRKKWF